MASTKTLGLLAQRRSRAGNHVIRDRSGKVRQGGRGVTIGPTARPLHRVIG